MIRNKYRYNTKILVVLVHCVIRGKSMALIARPDYQYLSALYIAQMISTM